ncbi:unnamed protein product [Pylaiella littoralis]
MLAFVLEGSRHDLELPSPPPPPPSPPPPPRLNVGIGFDASCCAQRIPRKPPRSARRKKGAPRASGRTTWPAPTTAQPKERSGTCPSRTSCQLVETFVEGAISFTERASTDEGRFSTDW